jgi:hypothetical protein
MTDPLHRAAQRRKRQYESEARIRKLREGWMPWTRQLPLMLVSGGPFVWAILGSVFAIEGAGLWGLAGGVAAAVYQFATDLRRAQQRTRSKTLSYRIMSAGLGLAMATGGVALASTVSWWPLHGLGWIAAVVGVWGYMMDVLVEVSLVVVPPPTPEPTSGPEPASNQQPQPGG